MFRKQFEILFKLSLSKSSEKMKLFIAVSQHKGTSFQLASMVSRIEDELFDILKGRKIN